MLLCLRLQHSCPICLAGGAEHASQPEWGTGLTKKKATDHNPSMLEGHPLSLDKAWVAYSCKSHCEHPLHHQEWVAKGSSSSSRALLAICTRLCCWFAEACSRHIKYTSGGGEFLSGGVPQTIVEKSVVAGKLMLAKGHEAWNKNWTRRSDGEWRIKAPGSLVKPSWASFYEVPT